MFRKVKCFYFIYFNMFYEVSALCTNPCQIYKPKGCKDNYQGIPLTLVKESFKYKTVVHQDGTKNMPVYMWLNTSVCFSDLNMWAHCVWRQESENEMILPFIY